ncbi:MAG: DUF3768 domain-containing protein [Rhodospirillaceae bacterium]
MNDTEKAAKIALLNDQFRSTFTGGQVFMTAGINALDERTRAEIIAAVMEFDAFDEDNDPYGEHDYGTVQIAGKTYVWKIDTYDLRLKYMSPDPSDPAVTRRVLTILLPSEW